VNQRANERAACVRWIWIEENENSKREKEKLKTEARSGRGKNLVSEVNEVTDEREITEKRCQQLNHPKRKIKWSQKFVKVSSGIFMANAHTESRRIFGIRASSIVVRFTSP
jgi:hypothetical protein